MKDAIDEVSGTVPQGFDEPMMGRVDAMLPAGQSNVRSDGQGCGGHAHPQEEERLPAQAGVREGCRLG